MDGETARVKNCKIIGCWRYNSDIMAILAALLLPVLSRAKAMSLRVVRINNLKQTALGIHLYAADNEDSLPGPLLTGIQSGYNHSAGGDSLWPRLGNSLWSDLGLPDPSGLLTNLAAAPVLTCPAQMRQRARDVAVGDQVNFASRQSFWPDVNVRINSSCPFRGAMAGMRTIGQHSGSRASICIPSKACDRC